MPKNTGLNVRKEEIEKKKNRRSRKGERCREDTWQSEALSKDAHS